ncbi:hypothetical protein FB567DRAFT_566522 [Paraphoma chrysanthemicola]|uniref:Carbohydrate-binding module family 19 domain-containing protein n=1 Tax=Paraphoma chrysanthemicola TaxID=798071 RepID=A0A8K0RMC2_9PLEO|nr:hypothetical protein FB567DRAFT_566522 [Paraphoma chrysanthemicola]
MFSTTTVLGAILALAPMTANAHMVMAEPRPFSPATLNNGNLKNDGSDFPCKIRPDMWQVETMNQWPVGSTQKLKFFGTAVHGGGSCQISVSTDKNPTKDSIWKVIHSIEGGCPPPPTPLWNWPEPTSGDVTKYPVPAKGFDGFNFTIPADLPNGEMAMAWTWHNRIGNKEMYMNCGPITVTGGSDDKTAFEALPDMATSNIGGKCETPREGKDGYAFTFQNPGKSVVRLGVPPFKDLCGGEPTPGESENLIWEHAVPGGANVSSQAPAPSQPLPTPSPVAPPQAGDKLTSTSRIIVTVTASTGPKPTSVNGTATAAPPKASPPLSQAGSAKAFTQAPVASGAAPSGLAPPTGGQTCTTDGAIVCSADGKQFGLCNRGKAVMQGVAAGTMCKDSVIVKRDDSATTMKKVYA